MQEHPHGIDEPMLPVVSNDDSEPLDVPLMFLDETRVRLKSRKAFPAVEAGSVDQQLDLLELRERRHIRNALRQAIEAAERKAREKSKQAGG